ncbi:LamG-like jellyroll fold domain-containing protein [Bailinhaonella thermotolerans]|uniref:LamG domain-containing protein n=1 Tax=Bailinhaonella thermotolerans TaxID=1070861 RepID=A0A3A4AYK7_9ACTN|nr:LamG-like jellyroll fold domain-containing protein [Bailinhaonella thermotolerans]RJL34203.1 LamG domain-containing protein [Bailinhaonella thermotolerans]
MRRRRGGRLTIRPLVAVAAVLALLPITTGTPAARAAAGPAAPSTPGTFPPGSGAGAAGRPPSPGGGSGAGDGAAGRAGTAEPDRAAGRDGGTPEVREARRLGRRVQVQGQGTPSTKIFANADGTFTAEFHPRPVQARTGGRWTAIDLTLTRRPDGRVAPKAAAGEVSLSGGGSGPLATVGRDGRRLSYRWPRPLPAPELDGPSATYREVFPGVDLVARVTEAGFSEVLVVKNAKAARDPGLRRLRVGLEAAGLTPRAGKSGSLTAVDSRGRALVTSQQPRMWDSGGGRAGRSLGPREGDRRRAVRVDTGRDAIELVPDPALLTGADTSYPLFMDAVPSVVWQHWVLVSQAYPTGSWVDTTYNARTGANPDELINGVSAPFYRSFFQLFTAPLLGKTIKSAKFQAYIERAYDCTPAEWQLWQTGTISVETTWQNQPAWLRKIGSRTDSHGGDPVKCHPSTVGHDLKDFLSEQVAAGAETLTIGLRGAETARTGGKEFRIRDLIFAVEYNTIPEVPRPKATGMPCAQDWSVHIKTTVPELDAVLYDAEQRVRATYEWQAEDGTPLGTISTEYGGGDVGHAVTIPDGVLTSGGRYRWRVRADDGEATTAWSPWCQFSVDTQPPTGTPVITSPDFPANSRTGLQYQYGVFTFDAGGNTDVAGFMHGINEDPKTKIAADAPGGRASVTLASRRAGSNYVSARFIDRAGNLGPIRRHYFTLVAVSGPIAWWTLNDGSGETAVDSASTGGTANRHPLTLTSGAAWGQGRAGDGGLRFDGAAGEATAGHPVLDTTKSFTVMGWVKIDNQDSDWPIITQDGSGASAVSLNYRWWMHRWALCFRPQDGETCALSNTGAQTGVWTHVAGVHDAERRELRVYVNGRHAGTTPHTGSVNADGPLRVGKMSRADGHVWLLPGELDDLRAYARVVSADELRTVMGVPRSPASAEWRLDETEGRVAADDTGNRHTLATTSPGASWGPGRDGGALHLDGQNGFAFSAGPVVPTDQSFSAAAWVRLDSKAGTAVAVSQDGEQDSAFTLGFDKTWGRWAFAARAGDGSGQGQAAFASALPVTGRWTHLAGVYDADMRQLRLYVDGKLTATAAREAPWAGTGAFVIGGGKALGLRLWHWKGAVDAVHAVDRVLTPGDIAAIMKGRPAPPGGTFGFDEGAGDVTTDTSGNGHRLQVAESAAWTPGVRGSAIAFDGSGSQRVYSGGPLVRTDGSFTVAAWVRHRPRTPKTRAVAVSQDSRHYSGFALGYAADTDRWEVVTPKADSPGSVMIRVTSRKAAVPDRWTHLAAVYTASNGVLRFYVDAVLQGSATLYRTWTAGGSFIVGHGQWDGWWLDHWAGDVDEVRVGEYAASDAQVKDMYGMPDPPPTGPIKIRSVHSGLCLTEQGGSTGFLYQGNCASVSPPQSLEKSGDTYRVTTMHPSTAPAAWAWTPTGARPDRRTASARRSRTPPSSSGPSWPR